MKNINGVTIDGIRSLDLDDAIWVEKRDDNWLVTVCIADVAQSVYIGSGIDKRAREMAFSRYYARYTNHMLPLGFATDKVSLMPDCNRYVLAVTIPIDKYCKPGKPIIEEAVLRSKAKLYYEEVVDILRNENHELHEMLDNARQLADLLLENRQRQGALAIYDFVKGMATTEEGFLVRLPDDKANIAHIIVQELMILTNSVISEYFAERNVPILYRNHEAKSIASDRNSLMEDLRNYMLNPQRFSFTTLRKKMQLVLNRAYYAPHLKGHYGLNLPAYTHFTSPIRRYADLVNHRIIKAYIKGEQPPYTVEELEENGRHINELTVQVKEEVIEIKKEKSRNRAEYAIDNNTLHRLDKNEFHQVVKVMLSTGKCTEELEEEIADRIARYTLHIKDYALIIFTDQKYDFLKDMQFAAYHYVRTHPPDAITLFTIAEQKLGIPAPRYYLNANHKDQRQAYRCSASLHYRGYEYKTEEMGAKNNKLARQRATAELIRIFLGIDEDTAPPARDLTRKLANTYPKYPEPGRSSAPVPMENYKGKLFERCQSSNWPRPVFEVKRSGPSNDPEFACTAILKAGIEIITSTTCRAAMKKQAEQLAAASLLEKIGYEETETKDSKTVPNNNYISAINQFCQKENFPMPEFEVKSMTGPAHEPLIILEARLDMNGRQFTVEGQGKSKQLARQMACRQLYDLAMEIYPESKDV